ncbi:MAG: hypothetical protein AAF725_26285 [Acidobacteriota bacterium]
MIRTERCAAAFGRMYWAFLFFIDFQFGVDNVHVDILPDLFGWILIASALTSILDLAPRVPNLRKLAYWLCFLSLFDLVEIRIPVAESGVMSVWITPTFAVDVIYSILKIVLIWKLCGLIMDMAWVVQNETMRRRAHFRRRFYVVFHGLLLLVLAAALAVQSLAIAAILVALPLSIVLFFLMMGLMGGTEKMCRGMTV